jgi:hypothetical protein
MLAHPRLDLARGHGPGHAGYFPALPEEDEAWYGLDGEARTGQRAGPLCPSWPDGLTLESGSSLGKGRAHHLARPAPGRPEVHEDGQGRAGDETVEGLVREVDGLAGRRGLRIWRRQGAGGCGR